MILSNIQEFKDITFTFPYFLLRKESELRRDYYYLPSISPQDISVRKIKQTNVKDVWEYENCVNCVQLTCAEYKDKILCDQLQFKNLTRWQIQILQNYDSLYLWKGGGAIRRKNHHKVKKNKRGRVRRRRICLGA